MALMPFLPNQPCGVDQHLIGESRVSPGDRIGQLINEVAESQQHRSDLLVALAKDGGSAIKAEAVAEAV
jgi:hypothetical protein